MKGKERKGKKRMGSGPATFFKVVIKNLDVLAGPVVGLVYPLYGSMRAMETKSEVDNEQWLTYWVLHSMLTLLELSFGKIVEWIPIWGYVKLVVLCWLSGLGGAAYVYHHYLRPIIIMNNVTATATATTAAHKYNYNYIYMMEEEQEQYGTGDLQYNHNHNHNAQLLQNGYYAYPEDEYNEYSNSYIPYSHSHSASI